MQDTLRQKKDICVRSLPLVAICKQDKVQVGMGYYF